MAEFKLGDRVVFVKPYVSRYGRITFIRPYWRNAGNGEEPLYTVRYYDSATGKLMKCPDLRCRGANSACPICSRNSWNDEITKIDDHDIAYFKKYGFIQDADELGDQGVPCNYIVEYPNLPEYKGCDEYVVLTGRYRGAFRTTPVRAEASGFTLNDGTNFLKHHPRMDTAHGYGRLIAIRKENYG